MTFTVAAWLAKLDPFRKHEVLHGGKEVTTCSEIHKLK